MGIDEVVFKLLILLMPGITGLIIYKKLAVRRLANKKLESLRDLPSILLIALLSSGLFDIFAKALNRILRCDIPMTFTKLLSAEMFEAQELLIMVVIAVICSTLFAMIENKKVIYKIARKLKITSHYGDDDVWTFVNNSPDLSWIFVRDHSKNLVYFGLVEQYSDPGEIRELLLSDVRVYTNDTGKHLYDSEKVYLCRNSNEITIEIPHTGAGDKNSKGEKKDGKKENDNKTAKGRKREIRRKTQSQSTT